MLKSILFIGAASARLTAGSCPDIEYTADFDANKYAGKWYEQVRDRFNPFTITTDCVTKEFAPDENNDIQLYFRGYYNMFWRYSGVEGMMYQCDEGSDDFTCMATMGPHSRDEGQHRIPFHIFDTDYESYDISYECYDFHGFVKYEMFSVATREENASKETMDKVKAVIDEKIPHYKLDSNWLLVSGLQGEFCDYEWNFE